MCTPLHNTCAVVLRELERSTSVRVGAQYHHLPRPSSWVATPGWYADTRQLRWYSQNSNLAVYHTRLILFTTVITIFPHGPYEGAQILSAIFKDGCRVEGLTSLKVRL